MVETLSRADELRNDLENMHFAARYWIGVLAELEGLGKQGTPEFIRIQNGLNNLKSNIRRIAKEIDNE